MNLIHTTFTGIDEKTSLDEVMDISFNQKVEWGILYSESLNSPLGKKRYPSKEWFEKYSEKIEFIRKQTNASFALHVCGGATKKLLNQEDEFLNKLITYFDRVQINFIYKDKYLNQLEELLQKYSSINFITQHNNANKELYTKLILPNHHILFDQSGGRGIVNEEWEQPLENKFCGYAGGLGEDNIRSQLINIASKAMNSYFWIDMEGKIRTDDYLDLKKCKNVLEEVNKILNNEYKFSI